MRATEFLTERTLDDGSKLVASLGDWWIWQVPHVTYDQFYQKHKNRGYSAPQPATADKPIFFVSRQTDWQKNEILPTGAIARNDTYGSFFVTLAGEDLRTLIGAGKISSAVLRKLSSLTGAKNAPDLETENNAVLYQGKVRSRPDMVKSFAQPPLNDGTTVIMVPKNLWWTIGPTWITPADTLYRLINPLAREITFMVKDRKIIQAWYAIERAASAIASIRELATRDGLTIDADLPEPKKKKKQMIKPGSNMHKMLSYVGANPGCSRSDWFVKHLGLDPQGMQGFASDKSADGRAAMLGWLENTGTPSKYRLELTMMGHMILGVLDAGNPVPVND
jgi:hypothetical protein